MGIPAHWLNGWPWQPLEVDSISIQLHPSQAGWVARHQNDDGSGNHQGMAGSTAFAFGRGEGDRTSIDVVTNGGMSFPLPTGLEAAKVVKLDVGIAGHSLI